MTDIEHCAQCERLKYTLDTAHRDRRSEVERLERKVAKWQEKAGNARRDLRGAVGTLRAIAEADVDLISGKPQKPSGEYCVRLAKKALDRLEGQ